MTNPRHEALCRLVRQVEPLSHDHRIHGLLIAKELDRLPHIHSGMSPAIGVPVVTEKGPHDAQR